MKFTNLGNAQTTGTHLGSEETAGVFFSGFVLVFHVQPYCFFERGWFKRSLLVESSEECSFCCCFRVSSTGNQFSINKLHDFCLLQDLKGDWLLFLILFRTNGYKQTPSSTCSLGNKDCMIFNAYCMAMGQTSITPTSEHPAKAFSKKKNSSIS